MNNITNKWVIAPNHGRLIGLQNEPSYRGPINTPIKTPILMSIENVKRALEGKSLIFETIELNVVGGKSWAPFVELTLENYDSSYYDISGTEPQFVTNDVREEKPYEEIKPAHVMVVEPEPEEESPAEEVVEAEVPADITEVVPEEVKEEVVEEAVVEAEVHAEEVPAVDATGTIEAVTEDKLAANLAANLTGAKAGKKQNR